MTDKAADGFRSVPSRVAGELDERRSLASRALAYGVPFLDDALRALLPHDLVLLGAPSGVGKTDLAISIAAGNARAGRRVHYFALEAEPREIERRIKFARLVEAAAESVHPRTADLNFVDWMLGRCEHVVEAFNATVDQSLLEDFCKLRTFYRGAKFDQADLRRMVLEVATETDLIVIDHLHYVDTDTDENEHRALGELVKTIRDLSLRIGKPIILIAHLRKRDPRAKQLVATLDDFHGSSNVAKIATHAITIERAPFPPARWYLAPTFVSIAKDRRGGAPGVVALAMFDRRFRTYAPTYTLGRLKAGGTEWEPLAMSDVPRWARQHRALEGSA